MNQVWFYNNAHLSIHVSYLSIYVSVKVGDHGGVGCMVESCRSCKNCKFVSYLSPSLLLSKCFCIESGWCVYCMCLHFRAMSSTARPVRCSPTMASTSTHTALNTLPMEETSPMVGYTLRDISMMTVSYDTTPLHLSMQLRWVLKAHRCSQRLHCNYSEEYRLGRCYSVAVCW